MSVAQTRTNRYNTVCDLYVGCCHSVRALRSWCSGPTITTLWVFAWSNQKVIFGSTDKVEARRIL